MLEKDPENLLIYYSLGVVHFKKGDFLEAVLFYQETLLLDLSHSNVWQNLCHGYHMLGEDEKAQKCLEGE